MVASYRKEKNDPYRLYAGGYHNPTGRYNGIPCLLVCVTADERRKR
jgi:hypothetical protein